MVASLDIKASLLTSFHVKSALSIMPSSDGPTFQLGDVQWGYGLIEESSSGEDLLMDIPSDMDTIDGMFLTSTPTYTYVNGIIIMVIVLPKSQLASGQVYKWSTIGILDSDEELVGVVVVNPMSLSNRTDVTLTLEINTASSTVSAS